jgi:hypothetical protein
LPIDVVLPLRPHRCPRAPEGRLVEYTVRMHIVKKMYLLLQIDYRPQHGQSRRVPARDARVIMQLMKISRSGSKGEGGFGLPAET